jgi:hypothetical protein
MNPLAQIEHVKSRLSAAGEYVPTVKEFERILRNAGCSRNVAKQIVYRIKSLDGSGEMPEPEQCNADDVAKALMSVAEVIQAEAIRTRFSKFG